MCVCDTKQYRDPLTESLIFKLTYETYEFFCLTREAFIYFWPLNFPSGDVTAGRPFITEFIKLDKRVFTACFTPAFAVNVDLTRATTTYFSGGGTKGKKIRPLQHQSIYKTDFFSHSEPNSAHLLANRHQPTVSTLGNYISLLKLERIHTDYESKCNAILELVLSID